VIPRTNKLGAGSEDPFYGFHAGALRGYPLQRFSSGSIARRSSLWPMKYPPLGGGKPGLNPKCLNTSKLNHWHESVLLTRHKRAPWHGIGKIRPY
jgi:hypothetical protein